MIVYSAKPIIISFVAKKESPFEGKMATLWSFSFPTNRKKLQDGTYKTFYTTGYYWDRTNTIKLFDKQQLNNVTFNIEQYIDNNGMRRTIWFVTNYDLENTKEQLQNKTWEF